MLRIKLSSSRRLLSHGYRAHFPLIRTISSSSPDDKKPNSSATTSATTSKPASGQKNGDGGKLAIGLLASAVLLAYASLKLEGDEQTAQKVTSVISGAAKILVPIGSKLRQTGLFGAPAVKEEIVVQEDTEESSQEELVAEQEEKSESVSESNADEKLEGSESASAVDDDGSEEATVEEKVEEIVEASTEAVESAMEVETQAQKEAEKGKDEKEELPLVLSEKTVARLNSTAAAGILGDVTRQSIALRKEIENTLLNNLNNLDAPALRIRLSQMASELFERISWENIRLSRSLKEVEAELGDRYTELMKQQRKELQLEIDRILFEQKQESYSLMSSQSKELVERYENQLNNAIRSQAEGFQNTLQHELEKQRNTIVRELQDQLNHEVAQLRLKHTKVLEELHPRIDALTTMVSEFYKALDDTTDSLQKIEDNKKLSSSVLALEMALSSSATASAMSSQNKISTMKKNFEGDDLVVAVLDSIPETVINGGALSMPELQIRFKVMREEVRKAALAPESAPKMIGQLIGSGLAAISSAPKGYVTGQGVEEALARAAFYLDRGQLRETLAELNAVDGYSKVLMKDWLKLASDRLIVDQSMRAIKAKAMLRFHQNS